MNSLSWLIYFIGMLDTLRGFMIAGFVFCVIAGAISSIVRFVAADQIDFQPHIPATIKFRNWCVGFAIALPIAISIIPSKDTVVLIAASEIGERVLNSNAAQDVANEVRSVVTPSTELLRTWIETQTRQLRGSQQQR